jgi:hypothetical protein
MKHPFFYNGTLYQWEIVHDNPFYGRDTLYRIYTDEESYSTAKRAVLSELNTDNAPNKGLYDLWVRQGRCTIENHIKGYYRFSYNEPMNCFEYQRVRGYDD